MARPKKLPESQSTPLPQECLLCGNGYQPVGGIDLGVQPLANALLPTSEPPAPETCYPLRVVECGACGHIQLAPESRVPPQVLFNAGYVYRTGQSQTMRTHFNRLAKTLTEYVPRGGLVVDVGSNDLTFLKAFPKHHIRLVGVDPSSPRDHPTIRVEPTLLTPKGAVKLAVKHGRASVVLLANCLAHTPEPIALLQACSALMDRTSLLVIEVPAGVATWTSIYHEHYSYWTRRTMHEALRYAGLECLRFQELQTHGGSLRVFARLQRAHRDPPARERVDWPGFVRKVESEKSRLVEASEGQDLWGYTCPAKATVLLNATGIRPQAIADSTPEKQGKYLPLVGSEGIPIVPPEDLPNTAGAVLLLAPNYASEIMAREARFLGKWILP